MIRKNRTYLIEFKELKGVEETLWDLRQTKI